MGREDPLQTDTTVPLTLHRMLWVRVQQFILDFYKRVDQDKFTPALTLHFANYQLEALSSVRSAVASRCTCGVTSAETLREAFIFWFRPRKQCWQVKSCLPSHANTRHRLEGSCKHKCTLQRLPTTPGTLRRMTCRHFQRTDDCVVRCGHSTEHRW